MDFTSEQLTKEYIGQKNHRAGSERTRRQRGDRAEPRRAGNQRARPTTCVARHSSWAAARNPRAAEGQHRTGDKIQTTAGLFALAGKPALFDSTVAANSRAGGAVILGKTNLSEWANFRSFESVSGWSGRADRRTFLMGSIAIPAAELGFRGRRVSNFATVSFGTETDGSIVGPANASGVVGV